jgi:predicted MPP superfamily phosphohydrolase
MIGLNLLHISDLHSRTKEKAEFLIRRDALLKDLRGLQISPHLVFLTGDAAFSGASEEYVIAENNFINPLMSALGIGRDQLFLVPGNHDITRNVIDPVVADGIGARLSDTETAQTLLGHETWILPQQANYMRFLAAVRGMQYAVPYYSQVVRVDRVSIGVSVFDSAWLCLNDDAKNRIFLTRQQVQQQIDQVKGCALKIALLHHPLSWFHPSEQEIVLQDLRGSYDIVLTGHLHEVASFGTITPSSACIEITAPSFFAGTPRGSTDGYNLYSIDPSAGTLTARFRAFIRARKSYDSNVEHAHGGEFTFNLPPTAFTDQTSMALARKLTVVSGTLGKNIGAALSKAQNLEQPILLTAPAQEMKWQKTGKKYTPLREPYQFCMEHTCVLYSPPDAGSTIFLQDLSQQLTAKDRTSLYVNFSDIRECMTPEQLQKRLCKVLSLDEADMRCSDLSLIVDHLQGSDPEPVSRLLGFASAVPHMVICLKNDLLFDTMAASLSDNDVRFVRLRYWGPSRLREFVHRYIDATKMTADADAAVKFIWDSLSLSDLPVTPFLVALYLRVFFEFGGKITSISFVRLLERLEEDSLDRADPMTNYSIYNLRLILMWLAATCYKMSVFGLARSELEAHVADYFGTRALDVDAGKFVDRLAASGIVSVDADGIVIFTCVVFFNYYLAQAIETGEIDLMGHFSELHTALRLGDALAYYSGRHRDEERIARELMRCVEAEYGAAPELTSDDLEKYIHHLLNPETETSRKDEVAQHAANKQVDYEDADNRFERDQENSHQVGKGVLRAAPPKTKMEKVAWNILALKTFYNVFRNLEHIPAESKVSLLDRILDFHLHCNMDLIDLFSAGMDDDQFTSLCAYMVTIGGESFLSQNVGSAALQRTIEELLRTTKNDLKLFLLLCIYADLRLPGYAGQLESFLSECERVSILEMGYAKIHELLVRYEGRTLPASLISAFNTAFDQRQRHYGRMAPIDLQRLRDKALNEAKRRFLETRKDQVTE